MLIRSHMEELKDHTHKVIYEKYRSDKLPQNFVYKLTLDQVDRVTTYFPTE